MTIIYNAKIKRIHDNVEEEVTLLIQGLELVCFASHCPYPIKEGATYPVSLSLEVLHSYEVTEAKVSVPSMKRIDQTFSHVVTGKLDGMTLDAGLVFQDEIFLSDFGYLDGKMISVKIDRIDAEFV
jgi:hypothetical protein